ncbi:DUF4352 domain-containing protein [Arthrobacter sp. Sr24]
MKKSLVCLAAAALLLTGCGSTAESATAPSVEPAGAAQTSATAAVSVPAVAAEKSVRGNLIKKLGDGAGITDQTLNKDVASFVINSITVDGVCTNEHSQAPVNGHILILDVSVQTDAALAESVVPSFSLNPYSFKTIAPNGTTSNVDLASMATYSCLPDAEVLPLEIGPGEKATGKVVLDAETAEGTLVFKPGYANVGWEWVYPAS